MTKFKIIGLAASILLHAIILFLFLYTPILHKKVDTIIDKEHVVEVALLKKEDSIAIIDSSEGRDGSYPTDERVCRGQDKEYTGIGIIHSMGLEMIMHAPPFYPGYKAGLREGDIIISLKRNGDIVEVEAMRDNKRTLYRIKAEKICFNEVKDK